MPTRDQWSEATRIWRDAGYTASQVVDQGLHYTTVSNCWRGLTPWTDRIETAVLAVCEDPELVATVRGAQNVARRDFLVTEMAALVGGES